MSSNLSKKSQRNFGNHLKDRPSTSKEVISNSISKRTDRTSENFVNIPRQKSSSQEKELLSEQRGFSGKLMKQNIQIKALKSLIKNKYGSIPPNFLSILKNLDQKEENTYKKERNSNNSALKLLDFIYKNTQFSGNKGLKSTNFEPYRDKDPKNATAMQKMNKSYDTNTIKQKFLDFDKNKRPLIDQAQKKRKNDDHNQYNLHYMSDIRLNVEKNRQKNSQPETDSRNHIKKNLLPDGDLEEILDKFIEMEKIVNYKGFLQSMNFILDELRAKYPKIDSFLKKVGLCFEKLVVFLIGKLEFLEKQAEMSKKICVEKAIQTIYLEKSNKDNDAWQEKLDQLESQNSRLIQIIQNLNKRGIDIEKLFEKQMDILINPKHKISFSEIKRINIDSEIDSNENEENKKLNEENLLPFNNSNKKNNHAQFKLDLTKVNNYNSKSQNPNQNHQNGKNDEEIMGFHQEFMAKLNEFSESWRDAALHERKIP